MRHAEAADIRRQLQRRAAHWPIRLERLSIEDVPTLGTLEVPIFSPLTLVAGANGVGKTTLLRAMWGALDPSAAAPLLSTDRRLLGGRAEVGFHSKVGQHTLSVDFPLTVAGNYADPPVSVTHIDGGSAALGLQKEFSEYDSIDDFTNGISARDLRQDELAQISYILNRDYRGLRFFEIETSLDVVPFFEAEYGDNRYDTRTMGSGEISALYIWWRISRIENESVVLIEEPEAFLSYACQANLANFIISNSVSKRLCVVISTHSSPFITTVADESLRFISRGGRGIEVVSDNIPPALLKSVGIIPRTRATLFVEDQLGCLLCRALLEKFDVALSRCIDIIVRNGEGEITRALRVTSTFGNHSVFIGAYDGDVAASIPQDVFPDSICLPSDRPLEQEFRELARDNTNRMGDLTGINNFGVLLNSLEGADYQDWFTSLMSESGLSIEQLFQALFALWIEQAGNFERCENTYNALIELLDVKMGRKP